MLYGRGDGGFGADVAFEGFETGMLGYDFIYFGDCFREGWFGDVGHEHGGAFAGEEDRCFEADAAGWDGR